MGFVLLHLYYKVLICLEISFVTQEVTSKLDTASVDKISIIVNLVWEKDPLCLGAVDKLHE